MVLPGKKAAAKTAAEGPRHVQSLAPANQGGQTKGVLPPAAGVAPAPATAGLPGQPPKMPSMKFAFSTQPAVEGGAGGADGSGAGGGAGALGAIVAPTLQFSPRAQKAVSRSALSEIWTSKLEMDWPPRPYWFYAESDEERAAMAIQRFARAYLERRMLIYLHTMRRLIMILATRERKAARLIRERWLTKAILEKNSQRLRPVLEALLASVCKDKPDRLLDYATEWMRTSYPAQAAEAAAADVLCEWQPRMDVEPTQDGLMAYLQETNATSILEGIIERAIAAQPSNVTAYVVDELVALNPDVKLPEDTEDLLELLEAEEEAQLLAEEEALMDEEELIGEEEELLLEEEEVELDELESEVESEVEGEVESGASNAPGSGVATFLGHGPLATLEEDDEEDDDTLA